MTKKYIFILIMALTGLFGKAFAQNIYIFDSDFVNKYNNAMQYYGLQGLMLTSQDEKYIADNYSVYKGFTLVKSRYSLVLEYDSENKMQKMKLNVPVGSIYSSKNKFKTNQDEVVQFKKAMVLLIGGDSNAIASKLDFDAMNISEKHHKNYYDSNYTYEIYYLPDALYTFTVVKKDPNIWDKLFSFNLGVQP